MAHHLGRAPQNNFCGAYGQVRHRISPYSVAHHGPYAPQNKPILWRTRPYAPQNKGGPHACQDSTWGSPLFCGAYGLVRHRISLFCGAYGHMRHRIRGGPHVCQAQHVGAQLILWRIWPHAPQNKLILWRTWPYAPQNKLILWRTVPCAPQNKATRSIKWHTPSPPSPTFFILLMSS